MGVLPPFFGSKSDNYFSLSKILGVPHPLSRLAQLVERKTLNLVVVGSSPTVGVTTFSLLRFFFFLDMKAGIANIWPPGGHFCPKLRPRSKLGELNFGVFGCWGWTKSGYMGWYQVRNF